MSTNHKIYFKAAQNMSDIADESIHLMITSPPYPMIEMWDEIFSKQISTLTQESLQSNPTSAFNLMNSELNKIWNEVYRVLIPGGIACINIGDATRTTNKNFQLFPTHTEIVHYCRKIGFNSLPGIIWRKTTNAPNKFMGSGMFPPGAYITLEHEHILVFRKGEKREFKNNQEKTVRKQSAYFWEERNKWFSDLWEIRGASQNLNDKNTRSRSAVYPFEIAHRLINMFSIYNDTILDPFLGTGTTMQAAMCNRRNSVSFEIDANLKSTIKDSLTSVVNFGNSLIEQRLIDHYNFILKRQSEDKPVKHYNNLYKFPVITSQEKDINFNRLTNLLTVSECELQVKYSEYLTSEYEIKLEVTEVESSDNSSDDIEEESSVALDGEKITVKKSPDAKSLVNWFKSSER